MKLCLRAMEGRDYVGFVDCWKSLSAPLTHTLYIAEERRGKITSERLASYTPMTGTYTITRVDTHVGLPVAYDGNWPIVGESVAWSKSDGTIEEWMDSVKVSHHTRDERLVREAKVLVDDYLALPKWTDEDLEVRWAFEKHMTAWCQEHAHLHCCNYYDLVLAVQV